MIATSCTDAKILLHFLYIYIYITYHEALAFTFLSLTLYPPRDPMLAGYPVSVFIILYNICQSKTYDKVSFFNQSLAKFGQKIERDITKALV